MEISGSDTDSYVTVLEYDDHTVNYLGNDTATKSLIEKERYLRRAAQILDFKWSWSGRKTKSTQSREFPRTGLIDGDGYSISSTIIPKEVKYAQMETADALVAGVNLTPVIESGTVKRENVKAGPVSVDTEYSSPSSSPVITSINRLLSRWIRGSSMQPYISRG